MIELPTTDSPASESRLKTILIISHMKCGKTSNCLQIPDSLMINLEDSAEYYGGKFINIKKEARDNKTGIVSTIKEIQKLLRKKLNETGKFPYKRIIIDQLTTLEEIAIAYATFLYKQTEMGKNYAGSDVTELEYGRGYGLLRDAMEDLINPFKELCETLILLGHPKTSSINKGGVNIMATDLNVTGKLTKSIPGDTDANGIMYRDKDGLRNILSFVNRGADNLTGTRVPRLANKEFIISEIVDGKLVTHWDKIFVD